MQIEFVGESYVLKSPKRKVLTRISSKMMLIQILNACRYKSNLHV